jgi:hypothetical protein
MSMGVISSSRRMRARAGEVRGGWTSHPRTKATIGWLLVVLVALPALLLSGCRRPDPVFDRMPRPVGTRDFVRAERRATDGGALPLTDAEWQAVRQAHERYLTQFESFREAELIPYATALREASQENLRNDARLLRSLVNRHLGLVRHVESLDETLFADVHGALGPDREQYVERLASRRLIDVASALSIGDGGRALLDLRQLVDRFELTETERLSIEPTLREFDREAKALAVTIAEKQALLPLAHLAVLERRGPPERSVDPALRDNARRQAYERAQWERFAEARRELEVLLGSYADLVDRCAEGVAAVLDEEEAILFRRRLLQSRTDDDDAALGDPSAFQALVAARTLRVPREVRERIETMRNEFLTADEKRLREMLEAKRVAHTPGVFDAGGARESAAESKARKERDAAAGKARLEAAKRFRDEILAMVPDDVRAEIEGLRELDRERFPNALAELVGPGRVSPLVQVRPRGFGDRDPVEPELRFDMDQPSSDPGEIRFMLSVEPSARDIRDFLARAGIDGPSALLAEQVVSAWRPRWEATRQPARDRIQRLLGPVMESMNKADIREVGAAVERLITGFDALRSERMTLDDDLLSGIEAALPDPIDPSARTLWKIKRDEASRRLRWRDVPFEEVMQMPAEVLVPFADLIAAVPAQPVDLPRQTAALAAALEPYAERLANDTESLRDATLVAARKILLEVVEARTKGVSEREAVRPARPEIRRVVAPMQAAAERLAETRMAALASVVATLPTEEGRALRESFVRAMYPRLLEDRRHVERGLRRLSEEPLLSQSQQQELAAIIEERGVVRDAALDRLLDWARSLRQEPGASAGDFNGRDEAARRHPRLAAVLFDREEADARAMHAALRLISAAAEPQRSDMLARHRELSAYFNDPPALGRWLD